jgi:hypothetical protein
MAEGQASIGDAPFDLLPGEARAEERADHLGPERVAGAEPSRLVRLQDADLRHPGQRLDRNAGLRGEILDRQAPVHPGRYGLRRRLR